MALGVVALYRALADRLALEEAGHGAPPPGDVVVDEAPLRVDAFVERDTVRLGGSCRLALRLTLAEGWHVNPENAAAADLVPSRLALAEGAPARLEGVDWPEPVRRALAPGQAPVDVLEGTVWVRARLVVPSDVPPGPRLVPLRLIVQPCSGTECLAPREVRLDLKVRYDASDGPARHDAVFPR
jgi:hypothetical protein